MQSSSHPPVLSRRLLGALAGASAAAALPLAVAGPAGDDAELPAAAAGAAAAIAAPGGELLAMGRWLKMLQRRHHELDVACLNAPADGLGKDALYDRASAVFDEAMELQRRIFVAPAQTAGDVVVQAFAMLDCAGGIHGSIMPVEELKADVLRIALGAASITRWALRMAKIEPAEVGYGNLAWSLGTWARDAEARLDALDLDDDDASGGRPRKTMADEFAELVWEMKMKSRHA